MVNCSSTFSSDDVSRWLLDKMTRADALICTSQNVITNLYNSLQKENQRRQNGEPDAPRIFRMLRVPLFNWPTKPKPGGDATVLGGPWLLILTSKPQDRQVLFRHPIFSMREASRNNRFVLLYRSPIVPRLVQAKWKISRNVSSAVPFP